MPERETVQAVRVHRFASFFKHYMGVSTIVTAALPIPVAELKLIPVFESQKHFLAVYTSLFCFLGFAFCFYVRHAYGAVLFGRKEVPFASLPPGLSLEDRERFIYERERHLNMLQARRRGLLQSLPFLLILISIASVLAYHFVLDSSIGSARRAVQSEPIVAGTVVQIDVLRDTPADVIVNGELLMILYFAIFLTAELAFVLMAMKEYLLDLLKIPDDYLIAGYSDKAQARTDATSG